VLKGSIKLLNLLPFFLIPFLGGNHLSLYYVTIDKFWIETTFILSMILAILFQYVGMARHSGEDQDRHSGESRNPVFFKNNLSSFFLFSLPFFAVNAISLIYTWNRFSTLNELNILVWILGAVYLFSITDKKESLLKALVIGAALSVACMIVQARILFPKLLDLSMTGKDALALSERVVPFSSFINESPLGGFFLTLLPVGLYFAVFKKSILCMIASVFILFGLLFSMSRMAIIIAFFSLAVIAFFAIKKRVQYKNGIMILSGILISTCILFAFVTYGNTVGVKQNESINKIQERMINRLKIVPEHITSLDSRTGIWATGMHAFSAQPFSGYGAGTFEYAYRKFYAGGIYTQYAHSSIMKIAVETGIPGLLTFLFYLCGTIPGIRKFATGRENDVFLVISIVSGFLFSALNVAFEVPAYLITFFVLSSIFFTNYNSHEAKGTISRLSYIIPGLIVLMLACSFFFTSRAGLAEKSIQNGIACEENRFLIDAYNSYQDAINLMPIRSDGYTRTAGILMQLYNNEGETQKKTILRDHLFKYANILESNKDKDSELMFVTGIVHGVLGNIDAAERYIKMARVYYPASAYYTYEAAKFYYINKQIEKAETAIRSIDMYMPQYLIFGHNLHGLYLYKIKDLESLIEYQKGKPENALKIAAKNLEDAENDKFSISKAREYTTKEQLIGYLRNRVRLYESAIHEKQNIRN